MIRYFLAKGDQGGSATVTEGLDWITCSNPPPLVHIATLYMKTYCKACKREGFIAPDGPRHGGTAPNGKPWALGGDINVCGCNPPPVFHAPERGMFMRFTSEELAQMSAPFVSAYVPQREHLHEESERQEEVIIEQYYELIDASTGQRASGYRYDLFIKGQQVSRNEALADGRSTIVRSGLSTDIVIWLDKSRESLA